MTSETFTLTLWGDWSPGLGMADAPLDNPAALYGGLYPLLQRADLNILNLEGVFVPPRATPIVKDGGALPLPPNSLTALAPFGMVCLANNHIMDYGLPGLHHTLEVLHAQGIAWTGIHAPQGAPASPPTPLPAWLHILNAAEGEEARARPGAPGAHPLDLTACCAEVRQQHAAGKTVIVILHAGREHWCFPAPYLQQAARRLAEAGATLVVGHHPHVPQGRETWHGTPIFYSLGNFALYPPTNWRWHTIGYGLEVRFSSPAAAPEITIHPYEIFPTGLRPLAGKAAEDFIHRTLPDLSTPLTLDEQLVRLWDAYVDDFLARRGLAELLGIVRSLGGTRWGTASLWGGAATQMSATHLKGRVFRRLLQGGAALLGGQSPEDLCSPEKARQAAILRNRFDTPAHREVWLHGLQRVMDGSFGDSPPWALEALERWRLL